MLLRPAEPSQFGIPGAFNHYSQAGRSTHQTKSPPGPSEDRDQRTLIIGVQLSAAEIHQQWILGSLGQIEAATMASTINIYGIRIALATSALTRDNVRYYLPQTTLDDYTDVHGLRRVSFETKARTYPCQVFIRLTQLILPSLESPKLSSPTFMQYFAMLFCAHVAHIHDSGIREPVHSPGGLSAWQKRAATKLLATNRYENTKLSTLADECHLSVSHFARSFKTSFGQPLHRWLVNQRVEKSKILLLHSNSPLLEVAFQAGFTDQATFNRTFAKIVGTSPGRWRKAYKER